MTTARLSSASRVASQSVDLEDPRLYLNRALGWLQLNWRVLEEALDTHHPLLERVKFLTIFANNLDEFFMLCVSGLHRQVTARVLEISPDSMTPSEQLLAIRNTLTVHLAQQAACWHNDLLPKLRQAGVRIYHHSELQPKQRSLLRQYFAQEIFPVLTPLAFDPAHPFPHISNLSFNLAVVVHDPQRGECFARVKVEDVLPRLLRIPDEGQTEQGEPRHLTEVLEHNFVWIEDVMEANLDMLFPGLHVVAAYPFRVTRDTDLEIKDDEASALPTTVEEQVGMRHFGSVMRLEVDQRMPESIREVLTRNLHLAPYQVYTADGPLGMADLTELTSIDRPDLKDVPLLPALPEPLAKKTDDLFTVLAKSERVA